MRRIATSMGAVGLVIVSLLAPTKASAHCDTIDGPVVTAARRALDSGDPGPVFRWVQPADEETIRTAFARALAVRALGPEARELADHYFFETVVRVHRAGEGAPYTGLKPAGTDLDPAVRGADHALETGSLDDLVRALTGAVASGLRERFARAQERQRRAEESVQAGREFVDAYVGFVHYAEAVHRAAAGTTAHHGAHEPDSP